MVSVAAIIAVAVNTEGRREIVGLHIGPREAEPFWAGFLKSLLRRGLKGVKLVVSDAHEGLKAAITKVMGATWRRCRVHWVRNGLAYVPRGQHTMVAAAMRQAFLQPDAQNASQTWRHVADQLRKRWPKLAGHMDESEYDVLAFMGFPAQHRVKLHSVSPLERLNKEVKLRDDVVGIFPNEASIIQLIGAVLLEQNDEWQLQHRYMQVEARRNQHLNSPPTACWKIHPERREHVHLHGQTNSHHLNGRDRQRKGFKISLIIQSKFMMVETPEEIMTV